MQDVHVPFIHDTCCSTDLVPGQNQLKCKGRSNCYCCSPLDAILELLLSLTPQKPTKTAQTQAIGSMIYARFFDPKGNCKQACIKFIGLTFPSGTLFWLLYNILLRFDFTKMGETQASGFMPEIASRLPSKLGLNSLPELYFPFVFF